MAFEWITPGRAMSTLYSTSSTQPPCGTNPGAVSSENLYSLAFFTVASDLSHLLSIPCLQTKMDKSQRHCFLFYVYGWFFGLGMGLVAAIFSFVENDSITSRVCLTGAVVLSVVVVMHQFSLNTCGKKRFKKDCRYKSSSVCRISGPFLIMGATLAGTLTSDDPGGLFFICGVMSFACYFMAFIGFSVRLYRDSKKNSSSHRDTDHQEQVSDAEVHVYPEWVPQVNVIYNRDDDHVQINSTTASQAPPEMFNANGEPLPILKLPTYLEAMNEINESPPRRPPEYSSSTQDSAILVTPSFTMPSTQVHSSTHPESGSTGCEDFPPTYQDSVRGNIWAL